MSWAHSNHQPLPRDERLMVDPLYAQAAVELPAQPQVTVLQLMVNGA